MNKGEPVYRRLVKDMHLNPESEAEMDKRLGDWLASQEVTAD